MKIKVSEKYKKTSSWLLRARLIFVYHNYQMFKHEYKWSVRKTARYFDVSIGQVSESLKLVSNYDKIKDCKTRQEALEKVKYEGKDN